MKKLLCVLLSLALLLSLAGCNLGGGKTPAAPTETPTEPTQKPTEPTSPDATQTPLGPVVYAPEDPLNLMVYEGRYFEDMEFADEGMMHVMEVRSYGGFLTMEHGYYQDGSLYAFWVEEFWPNDSESFTDLYDPMEGQYQTFSAQYEETGYDNSPQYAALLYNDSGIAIDRGEEWPREYYVIDSTVPALHNTQETMAQQVQAMIPGVVGEGPVGCWSSWTQTCYSVIDFAADGKFFLLTKYLGTPAQIYTGAWILTEGNELAVLAERLGGGTMPCETRMSWELDQELGLLILHEQAPTLLGANGGYYGVYDASEPFPMGQSTALSYLSEAYGAEGYHQAYDGSEYSYLYCLPQIMAQSKTAEEINWQIRDLYSDRIEESLMAIDEGAPISLYSVMWDYCYVDTILAVTVHAYGENYESHRTFYYEVATDTQLYARDVVERLQLDEQAYLEGVRAAVEQVFELYHADLSEADRQALGYEEGKAWTLSDDNINLDNCLIVDTSGNVRVYVQMETVYGIYWECVDPFGTDDGSVG